VEDECAAVGMAVLDVFCTGADFVIVRKTEGSIAVFGFGDADEPTSTIETIVDEDDEYYYEIEDGFLGDEDDWDD
jgi:hypothetical protein